MTERRVDKRLLAPVLMGFFIMGFCDIVAPVTNIISGEFAESQQSAVSFLPSMVFLWFLLLSTPVAALMNRIGRKRTAMIGYAFTIAGLLVPYAAGVGSALSWYFIGFGLLGIGNTAIQVAVNPLLATIVPEERMTSYLTVGQIFRNTALLLLAPIITGWFRFRRLASVVADLCGLTLVGAVWLQVTAVAEPAQSSRAVGMAECFRLLRNRAVLLCTLGVACFIAADVGIGFVSVRLIDNPDSILTTTGFYALRIVGTLVGAWVLIRVVDVKYLRWNMLLALALCIAPRCARSGRLCVGWHPRLHDGLRFRHVLCFDQIMNVEGRAMTERRVDKRLLAPVLMGFFIMGFCDIVAPVTNIISGEFAESQQSAVSFLPSMVFLWFLLLSTPVAALMNRIGRKRTAMIGYAFTIAGLLVHYAAGVGSALSWYFIGFGLLGIGNTAIQVAVNPLLATMPEERMTSYLTVGQIFRNTALLLLAPIITGLVSLFGDWRLLLPIYAGLRSSGPSGYR